MGNLVFQATLGGQVNLVGPNTASTFDLNVPAVSSTLATLTGTETFTNKTLTSPVISGGTVNNASVGATTASSGAFTTLSASGTTTLSGNQIISVTDNTNAALRITQLGTGNSLLVEDSANPDSSPFVIDTNGRIIDGYTTATTVLDTNGVARTPQLQIHGTTLSGAGQSLTNWGSSGTSYSVLFLSKSKSAVIGTQGVVASGDIIGGIQFSGDDGTNFIPTALISSSVDGTPGTNDMPGRLVFSTTADGASTVTERMRIDSSGNLMVGTTSAVTAGTKLTVSGSNADWMAGVANTNASPRGLFLSHSTDSNGTANWFLYCEAGGSTQRMSVRSNGGIANFSANNVNLSDRREKNNFAPATSYLEKICAIPVQTFNYIDQNLEEDAGLTLGVVAQDVQAVAPELVSESNWGTEEAPKMRLSIYQTDLQYALMKSIQELKQINDTQAETINALTARMVALEVK